MSLFDDGEEYTTPEKLALKPAGARVAWDVEGYRIYPSENLREIVADEARAQGRAAADAQLMAVFRDAVIDHERLKAALEAPGGANPNRMIDGAPLVHHVVWRGDLAALQLLVRAGARLDDVDGDNMTALDRAALAHAGGIGEYLMSHGAESNYYDFNHKGGVLRPARLEDGMAGIQCRGNYQSRIDAEVCHAARGTDAAALRRALDLGGDADAQLHDGLSVLHLAVLNNNTAMARDLIARGADLHRHHTRGETTLGMLWWCRSELMLKPQWYEMAALIRESGGADLFFRLPEEMTADELLSPPMYHNAPFGGTQSLEERYRLCTRLRHLDGGEAPPPAPAPYPYGAARVLDYMTLAGRFDEAVDMIHARGGRLSALHLTQHSCLLQEKPVSTLRRRDQLHKVFTPRLWQDRLGEMSRVWAAVQDEVQYKPNTFTREDFNRAAAPMLAAQKAAMLNRGRSGRFKLAARHSKSGGRP